MTVQSLPFIPPAPAVRAKILPVWRLLWNGTRSSLSIWGGRPIHVKAHGSVLHAMLRVGLAPAG